MLSKADKIRAYILGHVEKHPADIAAQICKHFSVTRMTVTRQLQQLIFENKIIKTGKTSNARYHLSEAKNKSFHLKISQTLDEFDVFTKCFYPALKTLPENQYKIFEYCCTELINNAKDHSTGSHLHCLLTWSDNAVTVVLEDDGVGVFKKVQQGFHLPDIQAGLLTLTKGKVTTDSKNHTGEGIFFSSRMVDRFILEANGIRYIKDNSLDDWFYETSSVKKGTKISLVVGFDCRRTVKAVFHDYMELENFSFDKTEVLVKLSKFGSERYISRSQAKRILSDLTHFSRIVLDFRDIESVGQGFVDEVFRVFCNQHPQIKIAYQNANDDIVFMITRGGQV
ncbi:MAG: hypothetical protein A3E84_00820 [Gammaproteobacteria bacterium RIFCSPHIGHO2_12_FULL_42_13]|nr:MAG: hypothetical protein A3E84_00820 [Gammaproteobacteria bacterium RIFCSPHIGHO2_12_FULL_42_13]